MSFYTYEIEIAISSKSLSFLINKSIGTVNDSLEIQFSEIKSYKILFVNKRFADIIIYWNENKKNEYSFLREKADENKIDADDLLNKIESAIVSYNNETAGEKIKLLPSFYASNSGLFCIFFLIILFCIAIILHITYSVKTLPFSLFFGAALLFQLILRRKADIKFYRENK
jgi:hypothetical protein